MKWMFEFNKKKEFVTIPKHLQVISNLLDVIAVHAENLVVDNKTFSEAYEFLCDKCLKIIAKKLKINSDDIYIIGFKNGENWNIIEVAYCGND